MNCSDMTFWESDSKGREGKFLKLYALRTISCKPQTGYDLLKDIEKKTNGKWVPSKGMIYPLLDDMEKEGLIEIQEIGERSKKIFRITPKGEHLLEKIMAKHKEIERQLDVFRKLFFQTFFPQENVELAELFYIMRGKLMDYPDKEKAKKILKKTLEELS
ncbi:MAG: PadR family transcriptional regulator [Candidatus Thorarchaeota archaeon]|jgi:DNA-binding PadR family transcriptional regulator